ncbi:MAG: ribokinase [Anaerolineae bacterium]|nr:ribokinase [Anaerolineae bacterium]
MSDAAVGEKKAVVVGAACIDIRGQARGALVAGTSNPGVIRLTVGGVGRNIAEALGRLGVPVSLISAVGDDDWGRDILRRTEAGGVDVRYVRVCPAERSAAYLAVFDEAAQRVVSIDNMDLMRRVDGRYLSSLRPLFAQASIAVVDGNLSNAALQSLFRLSERYRFPLALDPTSAVLAARLRRHLHRFHMVTPDVAEAEVLSGISINSETDAVLAAQAIVAAGVKVAIVTMAEEGSAYATSETFGRVPAIRCEVVDRIGVGDVLTATVVFGILHDLPVDEAVRMGTAAAAYTIRCPEAVCPDLSLELLYDAIAP